MDIVEAIRLVIRRWYVVLPIIIATGFAAYYLPSSIQPEYRSQASVLLVGPPLNDDDQLENPLLNTNSALSTVAEIIAISTGSAGVRQEVSDSGNAGDYEVWSDRGSPIVHIETRSDSREGAAEAALQLVDIINNELTVQQTTAEVVADRYVSTTVLELSASGGGDFEDRTRARLTIAALGLALAATAGFAVESFALRRARRRRAKEDPESTVDLSVRAVDSR